MVMCFVPDCKHYSERESCRFFRFPKDEFLKKIWIRNIRRKDRDPSSSSLVCQCHFKDGYKSNGPTIFNRNGNKLMTFESPEKKNKKRNNRHSSADSLFSEYLIEDPKSKNSDDFEQMKNKWLSSQAPVKKNRRMTFFCSARGCNNFSNRKACLENKVTFHPFPLKNEVLLKFWLVQMGMIDFKPDSTSSLCSEHFEEDCFYYVKTSGRKALEKDAVPTKFEISNELDLELQAATSPSVEHGVCTMPTVLHINKKRKHEDEECDYIDSDDFNDRIPYIGSNDVSVQTAVSGISTQLVLQASSSVNSSVLLGSKDAEMQTRMDGISALLIENTSLQKKLDELEAKVKKLTFRVEGITDDNMMKSLTGFSSELFKAIYDYLFLEKQMSTYSNISPYNQYFLFMMFLRTGISQFFLSLLFKIGQPSTSRILSVVSSAMYNSIRPIKIWPSREQIDRRTSPIFFRHYPNCRVILEVVEFQIQQPTNTQTRLLTFSSKKNTCTVKGLVGKTPTGGISYMSDVWPGSISERELFLKSGMLDCLESGDLVIADKSFDIRDLLEEKECLLCTPKFLTEKIAFTVEEQLLYPEATHHRIHYDLATSKYNKFKFFDGQISSLTFDVVNEYFYIVGFLINFGKPLIHVRQH